MRLKADAAHRSGHSQLFEIARAALEHRDERTAADQRTDVRDLNALPADPSVRSISADASVPSLAMTVSDSLANPCAAQRVQPFGGPGHVLEHTNRE